MDAIDLDTMEHGALNIPPEKLKSYMNETNIVKNKTKMAEAIYENIIDLYPDFDENRENREKDIETVITYLEYYCKIMIENNEPCLNEQQIKQKAEGFFEEESNWSLVNTKSRDDILRKLLKKNQFDNMMEKKHKTLILDDVDGGSKRRKKTKKNKNTKKTKKTKKNKKRKTKN